MSRLVTLPPESIEALGYNLMKMLHAQAQYFESIGSWWLAKWMRDLIAEHLEESV